MSFTPKKKVIDDFKRDTEAVKAYGNAIVPQVMYEIFRAIEIVELKKISLTY